MGLNPPFGVKGALANKFVDHALQFDPKLIILIVPPETERYGLINLLNCFCSLQDLSFPDNVLVCTAFRLDRRRHGKNYDLIWEDRCLLSGKVCKEKIP